MKTQGFREAFPTFALWSIGLATAATFIAPALNYRKGEGVTRTARIETREAAHTILVACANGHTRIPPNPASPDSIRSATCDQLTITAETQESNDRLILRPQDGNIRPIRVSTEPNGDSLCTTSTGKQIKDPSCDYLRDWQKFILSPQIPPDKQSSN